MTRDLVHAVVSSPLSISDARRRETDGGAPELPGVYAWWVTPAGTLADVPTAPHPADPALRLIYIGISPRDDHSAETLRTRILNRHGGSSLSSSTLRRSLAALLWEVEGWTPRLTDGGRFTLSREDSAALRAWQERHLRVSWVHVARPWDAEGFVIRELEPPFNLKDNHGHPFYETMRDARRRFETAARARRPNG